MLAASCLRQTKGGGYLRCIPPFPLRRRMPFGILRQARRSCETSSPPFRSLLKKHLYMTPPTVCRAGRNMTRTPANFLCSPKCPWKSQQRKNGYGIMDGIAIVTRCSECLFGRACRYRGPKDLPTAAVMDTSASGLMTVYCMSGLAVVVIASVSDVCERLQERSDADSQNSLADPQRALSRSPFCTQPILFGNR